MRFRKADILPILVLLGVLPWGCAPTVRYTRKPATPHSSADQGTSGTHRTLQKSPGPISPQKLRQVVSRYQGVPYRRGGTSAKGLDCSGFVYVVFKELNGSILPRTTRKLRRTGRAIPLRFARPGDLVFFRGGHWNTINHVGIYLGKDEFAHASSSAGVTISSTNEKYYKKRYSGTRRVF